MVKVKVGSIREAGVYPSMETYIDRKKGREIEKKEVSLHYQK